MKKKKFDHAKFLYKCRRCGGMKTNTESSYKSAPMHLMGAVYKFGIPTGQSPLPMIEIHDCEDGGEGLADLIGFTGIV